MLTSLYIKNIVLIEQLNIEFQTGFCALTGETGAGKSILLDSLGLALGVRAESGLLRKGAEQASVTAAFDVPDGHGVYTLFKDQDITVDGPVILRRVLTADGRSRAYINDQPVSVGFLADVGNHLVEIHGQFETQGLLDPKTHGFMLDEYAGVDVVALEDVWVIWQDAVQAVEKARIAAQKAREEEEFLRSAIDDLQALEPKAGEEESLSSLRSRLMRRDQILESLSAGYDEINEAIDAMHKAWRTLEKLGEEGQELNDTLSRADAELQEAAHQVQSLSSDLEENEYRLPQIDDRLFALRAQARKHGCKVDELPEKLEELRTVLDSIEREGEILDDLKRKETLARQAYVAKAEEAAKIRREAAGELDTLVAKELSPLKLEKARFVVGVEARPEEKWGPRGMDQVRFLIATNPGQEPGPLNKIASGGEMSRFMLALKVVMAEVGVAGTYIFDEVDSGIGGPTAAAVGDRLARLAKSRQILVVTHSPQVAARAQHHYIVAKDGDKDVTTTVLPLAEAVMRQEEIARMLAGAEITDEARAAANKLLDTGT